MNPCNLGTLQIRTKAANDLIERLARRCNGMDRQAGR
jgi:hypothetical protein